MEHIFSRSNNLAINIAGEYNICILLIVIIFLFPFIIVLYFLLFYLFPPISLFIVSMLIDNQLVIGLLTSVFLIVGGILGLRFVLLTLPYKKKDMLL